MIGHAEIVVSIRVLGVGVSSLGKPLNGRLKVALLIFSPAVGNLPIGQKRLTAGSRAAAHGQNKSRRATANLPAHLILPSPNFPVPLCALGSTCEWEDTANFEFGLEQLGHSFAIEPALAVPCWSTN